MLIAINQALGGKIELLGSDACIMQAWEVATIAEPYANYYVASQDYESAEGWNYNDSMLDLISNPDWNGEQLGYSIAERFYQTGDLTQSVVDLSKIQEFNQRLNNFAQTLMDEQMVQAYAYALNSIYSYDGQWGVDRDLGGILEAFSESNSQPTRDAAASALETYNQMITSNFTRSYAEDATGLSIYSPQPNWGSPDNDYMRASWSQDSLWDDWLDYAH